ncbi:hypothetical protein B296_00049483, partial [Ensete ventricosum]
ASPAKVLAVSLFLLLSLLFSIDFQASWCISRYTSGRKLGEKQPKTGPPSPIKNRGRSSYWSPEGVSDRPPPAPDHPGSSAVAYAFQPDLVESNM